MYTSRLLLLRPNRYGEFRQIYLQELRYIQTERYNRETKSWSRLESPLWCLQFTISFSDTQRKVHNIYIFIYLYIYVRMYIYINFSFRFSYYYSRKKFFFFGTLLPTQFPPIPLCIIYSCTHLHMLPVFPNSIWHLYCFFFVFLLFACLIYKNKMRKGSEKGKTFRGC